MLCLLLLLQVYLEQCSSETCGSTTGAVSYRTAQVARTKCLQVSWQHCGASFAERSCVLIRGADLVSGADWEAASVAAGSQSHQLCRSGGGRLGRP